jgi:hypothetical protein
MDSKSLTKDENQGAEEGGGFWKKSMKIYMHLTWSPCFEKSLVKKK